MWSGSEDNPELCWKWGDGISWLFLTNLVARLLHVVITVTLANMTGMIRVTTVVVATAVFMVLAIGFFGWSNERQAQFTCEGGTHVAQPYDTLWQIASDRCTGNMQNAVYHFAELNGGSSIQIGQKVLIPTGPSE